MKHMKNAGRYMMIPILALSLSAGVVAQFSQTADSFINVYLGTADWADFNKDGFMDLAVAGMDSLGIRTTVIYKNNGDSTFTPLALPLPGVDRADIKWCDYNNDGFADLMILGDTDAGVPVSVLCSNDGNGNFTEMSSLFTGVKKGESAWSDYNCDGLQDVVITGEDSYTYTTILYKNNGDSTFSAYPSVFPGLWHSTADWGDFNRDGFPDLLLSGFSVSSSSPSTYVYSNDGDGTFSVIPAGIMGIAYGTARWGDFNNDGYADIFVSGSYSGLQAKIYRNNGDSTFTQMSVPVLEGLFHCDVSVTDFNNDGFTDILLAGHHGPKAFLYRNAGDFAFTKEIPAVTAVGYASLAASDFNNDGRQDLVISGEISAGGLRSTSLYINTDTASNHTPSVPDNLSSSVACGRVILEWTKGEDAETPQVSLTSAVYIGTEAGWTDIVAPGALPENGLRLSPEPGNAGNNTFMTIRGLAPGTYFWSVQTVDLAGTASEFADEKTFTIPAVPVADAGPDRTICAGLSYAIDEAELLYTPTGNYQWTSTGTGTFDNDTIAAPVYTPSADDVLSASVTLTFRVTDFYYCPEGTADEKVITIASSSILVVDGSPGLLNVCEGADTVLRITAEGNDLSYRWTYSEDGTEWTDVEGATSAELTFSNITEDDERYYSCLLTDGSGCTDSGTVTQLLVHDYPEKPMINESHDTLFSAKPYGYYTWVDEPGNTLGSERILVPESAGTYRLWVSDNSFCWSVSDPYAWEPTGFSMSDAASFFIYPNPASDVLIIQGKPDAGGPVIITLYGMNGKQIRRIPVTSPLTTMQVGDMARGLYFIEIKDNEHTFLQTKIWLE